jgi:DUF1680 family protein
LALAEFWLENRGRNAGKPEWEPDRGRAESEVRQFDYSHGRPSWGAYAQDHKPFTEQSEIVGHAVRATLFCSAIAAVGRINGREEYRSSALRLWQNMTYRRMHITGGVGAFSQEEKFGPDYVLPNDAYLETCAAVGAGFFHANMNRAFGDARYADELERALYNGVLCGVSLSGDTYTYQNPLVSNEGRKRWSWHDCPCCPPMFLKIMGAMPGYVYATDEDSLYVNLFVGSQAKTRVKGVEVAVRQTTQYPWDGQVRLAIDPFKPTSFGLMIRIPTWCRGASAAINGEKVSLHRRVRGYALVEREWRAGDVLTLNLPMPARAVHANPRVAENIGRVALMRGPLVYCVESVDAPSPWEAPVVGRNPKFVLEHKADLLGGVTLLHFPAAAFSDQQSLYESATPRAAKSRQTTAIPFYANTNRGPVDMAVWLPYEN